MVVKINAPAPALDLGAVNFSRAFAALGALSFCSLNRNSALWRPIASRP